MIPLPFPLRTEQHSGRVLHLAVSFCNLETRINGLQTNPIPHKPYIPNILRLLLS